MNAPTYLIGKIKVLVEKILPILNLVSVLTLDENK